MGWRGSFPLRHPSPGLSSSAHPRVNLGVTHKMQIFFFFPFASRDEGAMIQCARARSGAISSGRILLIATNTS